MAISAGTRLTCSSQDGDFLFLPLFSEARAHDVATDGQDEMATWQAAVGSVTGAPEGLSVATLLSLASAL